MDFTRIDLAIEDFVAGKNISVSSDSNSDWLVFDWRQLTWRKYGIDYLIELYPNFDSDENIVSWTFYTAASFDNKGSRYYIKKEFAKDVTLDSIAQNISSLLIASFDYISKIKKTEIPLALRLDQ